MLVPETVVDIRKQVKTKCNDGVSNQENQDKAVWHLDRSEALCTIAKPVDQ